MIDVNEWIDWNIHPVPEDVKGIFIKYEDGIFSDRYDFETKKRKYRESKILGWKFMGRSDPNIRTVQCNQPERSKREDSECDFCEGNCKCGLRQKNHLFITETIKNEEIVHKGPITFIV